MSLLHAESAAHVKSGVLYVVPTPIGNLEDITLRALRVLWTVDFVAAEDTRRARQLLTHYEIRPPELFSYREHNRKASGERIVALLGQGKSGALVSDAGMPVISDPGAELVRKCLEQDLPVVVLPGPSAFVTALAGSGISAGAFSFFGFLPRSGGERRAHLEALRRRAETLVFYEAPHRAEKTLADLRAVFGNRRAAVARELSKYHEEYVHGTLDDLLARAEPWRGELVLVVEGADASGTGDASGSAGRETSAASEVRALVAGGLAPLEAMRRVARERGVSRRDIYSDVLREKGGQEIKPGGGDAGGKGGAHSPEP